MIHENCQNSLYANYNLHKLTDRQPGLSNHEVNL